MRAGGCRLPIRGRGRVVRGRGRGAASGWLTSRSVIPASAVPEELIAQVFILFFWSANILQTGLTTNEHPFNM